MGSRGDAMASSLLLGPQALSYFLALAHSVPCVWSTLGAAGTSAWLPHLFRSLLKCHFPSAPSKNPSTSPTLSFPLLSTVPIELVHTQQTLHRLILLSFSLTQMQVCAGTDSCLSGSLLSPAPRTRLGSEELVFMSLCWMNDKNVKPLRMW